MSDKRAAATSLVPASRRWKGMRGAVLSGVECITGSSRRLLMLVVGLASTLAMLGGPVTGDGGARR
jgi:hypothetical protein